MDGDRAFIDHFHTCFVLKALAKIELLTGDADCRECNSTRNQLLPWNLFDEQGVPKPFSRPPRLIVYRRELYDYAECINLGTLLRGRFPEFDRILSVVLNEVLTVWQKADGSFRSRQLVLGWDEVPMHRWSQSQMFRSLCFLLSLEAEGRTRPRVKEDKAISRKPLIGKRSVTSRFAVHKNGLDRQMITRSDGHF